MRWWRSRLRLAGLTILASSAGAFALGPIDASWAVLGLLVAAAPFAFRVLLSSGFRCPRCCNPLQWDTDEDYCERCATRLP